MSNQISPDDYVLRLEAVMQRTGLARTSIYRKEREGTFPRHITLGGRNNASGWLNSEISAWLAERVAERGATFQKG